MSTGEIFVSYSRHDSAYVKALVGFLREAGLAVGRLLVLPLVLALASILAGCGRGEQTGVSGASSLPPARYMGPITKLITYEAGAITIDVPSSKDVGISWNDAYVNGCTSGEAICDVNKSPVIFLAAATITNSGDLQPDGSIKPILKDTLVYLIEYTNSPCSPVGPVRLTTDPPVRTAWVCTILNFVDATSGKVLFSVDGPDL